LSLSARRNVVKVRINDNNAVFGLAISSSNDGHVTFVVSFPTELFTGAVMNCTSEELSTGMVSLSSQE